MIDMTRYLVRSAFNEALRRAGREKLALTVLGVTREILIDLLAERGMTRARARQYVNDCSRLSESTTEQMAREAGFR